MLARARAVQNVVVFLIIDVSIASVVVGHWNWVGVTHPELKSRELFGQS
jgi:hypothetical protein